jgi:wyosine [tRNA(Phe)-imidazoG37] synthetase (radical SAM superfamily)
LGLSLGVSLASSKICTFNCIYCQQGRTQETTLERKEYAKIEEVLVELKSWLQNSASAVNELNYITISGLGEPTLNIKIADFISEVKKITTVPLAVITNASLLSIPGARQAILGADLVIPTLNTVRPEVFYGICRPHQGIRIDDIIQGLASLRKEFHGKIWLEVMLVKGLNDSLEQIRQLKETIGQISPDKIQLNSPVRATAEENILPAGKKKLEKIKEILGDNCEIV